MPPRQHRGTRITQGPAPAASTAVSTSCKQSVRIRTLSIFTNWHSIPAYPLCERETKPMLWTIARKELSELGRDRSVVAVLATYVMMLFISCLVSQWIWAERASAQAWRQHAAREDWLNQPTQSPHQATHRGTVVYQRPSPLAGVDSGVAPELGTEIRLEAHQRHETVNAARENHVRMLRLDFITPALLLQAILPLVIILISHGLMSREHEQGTWGLLASVGLTWRKAVFGKWLAVYCVAVGLSVPVLLTLILTVIWPLRGIEMSSQVLAVRAAALYGSNLLYLAGWCAVGTALSARFSAGTSFVLLISCWAIWTLILPRLAVDLADSRFPLPDERSLRDSRATAVRQGSDGRHSLQEFHAALEQDLLQKYGLAKLTDLPIDLRAARLLAGEKFTNALDDQAERQISEIFQQQYRVVEDLVWFSPYLSIRSISSALAGTDRGHHDTFINAAEQYRRAFVESMNTAEMERQFPGTDAAAARAFWNQVPEFQQHFPSATTVLSAHRRSLAGLFFWCLALAMLALLLPRGGLS